MLYTMQSHNLLILFSALNISFKTSALLLHFHPHYIPLRQWPYAFDNGLLPSDAPWLVFSAGFGRLAPKIWSPSETPDVPEKRIYVHPEDRKVFACRWQASRLQSQISHVIPQDTKVSKCTKQKAHIVFTVTPAFTHFYTPNRIFSVKIRM